MPSPWIWKHGTRNCNVRESRISTPHRNCSIYRVAKPQKLKASQLRDKIRDADVGPQPKNSAATARHKTLDISVQPLLNYCSSESINSTRERQSPRPIFNFTGWNADRRALKKSLLMAQKTAQITSHQCHTHYPFVVTISLSCVRHYLDTDVDELGIISFQSSTQT